MHGKPQFRHSILPAISHAAMIALPLAIMFVLAIAAIPAAQAQTLTVLHTFSGADGHGPFWAAIVANVHSIASAIVETGR